jgi:hypothetical protein
MTGIDTSTLGKGAQEKTREGGRYGMFVVTLMSPRLDVEVRVRAIVGDISP